METACWSSKWEPYFTFWTRGDALARLLFAAAICFALHVTGAQIEIIPETLHLLPDWAALLALSAAWGPAGLLGSLIGIALGGNFEDLPLGLQAFRLLGAFFGGAALLQLRQGGRFTRIGFLGLASSVSCIHAAWVAIGEETAGRYPFDYFALISILQDGAMILLIGFPLFLLLVRFKEESRLYPDTIRLPFFLTLLLTAMGPLVLGVAYFYCQSITNQPLFKAPVVGWSGGLSVRVLVWIGLALQLGLMNVPWRQVIPEDSLTRKGLGWRSVLR